MINIMLLSGKRYKGLSKTNNKLIKYSRGIVVRWGKEFSLLYKVKNKRKMIRKERNIKSK